VLAGGLGPDNVAEAVARVRPWGVDASSGLEEAPGIKDHGRVATFVREAKRA
jgi:phosphoribosylanthranilate isomerase